MPERLQLSRAPYWRLSDNHARAVDVANAAGPWTNPYTLGMMRDHAIRALDLDAEFEAFPPGLRRELDEAAHHLSVEAFACALTEGPDSRWWWYGPHVQVIDIKRRLQAGELYGRDLACWCQLPVPSAPDIYHAAVLLDHANRPENRP